MDNKVDFYVHGYQQVHIGGYTFWITTSHVCLVIVMVALIIFAIVANRVIKKADYRKAPTGFLNVIELLVETVDKLYLITWAENLPRVFETMWEHCLC